MRRKRVKHVDWVTKQIDDTHILMEMMFSKLLCAYLLSFHCSLGFQNAFLPHNQQLYDVFAPFFPLVLR